MGKQSFSFHDITYLFSISTDVGEGTVFEEGPVRTKAGKPAGKWGAAAGLPSAVSSPGCPGAGDPVRLPAAHRSD